MTLFLVAIVHALMVVVLVFLSMRISKRWERIEAYDFRHWREAKEAKLELSTRMSSRPCLARLLCGWSDSIEYSRLLELVRFHELKWRFLRNNHLPPHFHFTSYLRKAKQHVFRDLGSLPAGLWATLAAVLLLDLLLRSASKGYGRGVSLVVAVPVVSAAVLAGCVALFLKVRAVYWAIMHSQVVEIDAKVALNASSWGMVERRLRGGAAGSFVGSSVAGTDTGAGPTPSAVGAKPPGPAPRRSELEDAKGTVQAGPRRASETAVQASSKAPAVPSAASTPGPGKPDAAGPPGAAALPRGTIRIQSGGKGALVNATMPAIVLSDAQRSPGGQPPPGAVGIAGSSSARRRPSHRKRETLPGGKVFAPRARSFLGDSDGAGGGGSRPGSVDGDRRRARRTLTWAGNLSELGPTSAAAAAAAAVAPGGASRGDSPVRPGARSPGGPTSPGGATDETGSALRHTTSSFAPTPVVEGGCHNACCTGRHRAGDRFHQRDLFWFRNPPLLLKGMRGLVFVASVVLGTVVQFGPIYAAENATPAQLAVVGCAAALMILGLASLLERVVPIYVLTTHIGELIDERLLLHALRKSDDRHATRIARKIARAEKRRRRAAARGSQRSVTDSLAAPARSDGLPAGLAGDDTPRPLHEPSDTVQTLPAAGLPGDHSPLPGHEDGDGEPPRPSSAEPAGPHFLTDAEAAPAAHGAAPAVRSATDHPAGRPPPLSILHKRVARLRGSVPGEVAPPPLPPRDAAGAGRPAGRPAGLTVRAPGDHDRTEEASERPVDMASSLAPYATAGAASTSRSATPLPVAGAFWNGSGASDWAPGQARAVLTGGPRHVPETPSAGGSAAGEQAKDLTRDEWSALLAGLPEEQAVKLPRRAREALLEAFRDDLSSESDTEEEAEGPAAAAEQASGIPADGAGAAAAPTAPVAPLGCATRSSACGDWCSFVALPAVFGDDAEDTDSDDDDDDEVARRRSPVLAASPRPKHYRPSGLAGCVARLGDLMVRSRLWRAAVFIVIALGAASSVLQVESKIIKEVGKGVVTAGTVLSLVCGTLMLLELVLRLAGSAAYVCTGRAVVLVSPTPEEVARRKAVEAEWAEEDDAFEETGGAKWATSTGHGSPCDALAPCGGLETVARALWRFCDVGLLAASSVVLVVIGSGDGLLHPGWASLVTARLVFVAPWGNMLLGDPTFSDGHDHSTELAIRRRLHARHHHHHHGRHHHSHGRGQAVPAGASAPASAVLRQRHHSHHHHHHHHHRSRHTQLALGGDDATVASVLASRGEMTFYTDDRDYKHGYTATQIQVAAIASRLRGASARGSEVSRLHGPPSSGAASPVAAADAGPVIAPPRGVYEGSTASLTAARGRRWASTTRQGGGADDDDEAADTMTAALATELNIISARRLRSASMMVFNPQELASALEEEPDMLAMSAGEAGGDTDETEDLGSDSDSSD